MMGASLFQTLANYNPGGQVLENQQRAADVQRDQALTQATQAATQGQALQNQQAQRDLRDQEIMSQALQQGGGDLKKTINTAFRGGMSAKNGVSFINSLLQYNKALGTLDSDKLKLNSQIAERLGNIYSGMASADPATRQQMIPDVIDQIKEIDPTHPVPTPDQLNDPNWLATKRAMSAYEKTNADNVLKTRQAGEATARTNNLNATTEKTQQDILTTKRKEAATYLAQSGSQEEYERRLLKSGYAPNVIAKFPGKYDPQAILRAAMTPDEITRADQEAATAAETKRHNLSSESTARLNAAVNAGRLQEERTVNGMKYGPGTVEYWAQQLQENPDSVKELPPELRSSVGKAFANSTGLPLPTPLSGQTATQETAARNTLDAIQFVRAAMSNPEVHAQIGPILGRLGNAEQVLGSAAGLSPQAAQLAQQLRTRMRYLVFSEGRALMGGRLPEQLMSQLEQSSPNVRMDPNMLEGALRGVEGSALSTLDNADRQRFGGKMRSRTIRGLPLSATPSAGAGGPRSGSAVRVSTPDGIYEFPDQASAATFKASVAKQKAGIR